MNLYFSFKLRMLIFQAVWAGWGHASENPKLPELLHKHSIEFIGEKFAAIITAILRINTQTQHQIRR